MTDEAVIYVRISRDRTGAGLGIGRQEDDCRELAASLGLAVREIYADNDISAGGGKPRPGYRKMLADLEHSPATVLCWHTDRLHRKLAELEEYVTLAERRDFATHAVRAGLLDLATPSGRMIARMLGVTAAYELEQMRDRHQAAKRQQAAKGEWRGGRRPFGYEADGMRLRVDEAEALAAGIRAVIRGATLASVARDWNSRGIATSTGATWAARQLGRTMRRARNAGLIEHKGAIVGPAQWPPVVSEGEWRAVCAVLTSPARKTTPGPARRWLLSGLALCGVCGGPLIGTTTGGKNRRSRPVYRCRGAGTHVGRDASALDAYISGLVVGFLERPDSIAELARAMPAPDTTLLQDEIAGIRAQLDGLAIEARDRKITARQMGLASEPLMADLERLETRLAAAERPVVLSPFAGHEPAEVWEAMPLEGKRAVVAELFTVTVHPAPKGRPAGWRAGMSYFHAESVQIERNLGEDAK
jgi:DNA invertase Pin-like site-specific DNA recombinase